MKKKSKYEPGDYKFKVKRAHPGAGLALYAISDIPKGVCIIEYVGRLISEKEEYTSNSKYLFSITSKKTIDGTERSNTARYINHSCKPNAEANIHKGRVFIMSIKKINAGDEITYDYGKEYVNEHIKPIGCKCVKCKNSN